MNRRLLLSALSSAAALMAARATSAVPRPPGNESDEMRQAGASDGGTPRDPEPRVADAESFGVWLAEQQDAARALLQDTGVEARDDIDQRVEEESRASLERHGVKVPRPPILIID